MNRQIPRACAGFGLIELLISLLVFSVAMLGLARLQLLATRYCHSAYLYSVAANQGRTLANDKRAGLQDMSGWQAANQRLLPQGYGTVGDTAVVLTWMDPKPRRLQLPGGSDDAG